MLNRAETSSIVAKVAAEVKTILSDSEGGHDWWHIQRVWHNAVSIAKHEQPIDLFIVELAALLHDIADPKFHEGNEEKGPEVAREILLRYRVDESVIVHIENIIRFMSYKNSIDGLKWSSSEFQVVQDADRLDAIGAIGIARAFNYGGFKNRVMFDPNIPPHVNMTKEQYKKSQSPTINHFYEKLVKLKSLMLTKTGRKLAQERHNYMVGFLDQFYKEVGVIPDWHSKTE